MPRKHPNIIITGTPGVGKTTTSESLIQLSKSDTEASIPLTPLSINTIAKQNDLYESYDAELDTHVIDEDKLLDHVETLISDGEAGGFVIDWHVCDIFPERWIDLVVVLRCTDTNVFYERLTSGTKGAGGVEGRGYEGQKLQENIDSEIFGVIADEAKEGWPGEGRVVELESVEAEQIDDNAERIWSWCKQWVKDNAGDATGDGD